MRRFTTFLTLKRVFLLFMLIGPGFTLGACGSTPAPIPQQRPGDFRLGVVVMTDDDTDEQNKDDSEMLATNLTGGDARYIVDASAVLRASFGSGSSLEVFPGFTRRLNIDQMDAIWKMARNLLEHNDHLVAMHAGQPQSMVELTSGTIIEIHMNAEDRVYVFEPSDQQAAAIVDALAALAWADTTTKSTPTTRP